MVGLLLQFDPVPQAEAPGHLARELNPARPVQCRLGTEPVQRRELDLPDDRAADQRRELKRLRPPRAFQAEADPRPGLPQRGPDPLRVGGGLARRTKRTPLAHAPIAPTRPPESSPGRCATWLDIPVSASMAATRSRRSLARRPSIRSGIPTFSAADSIGTSPKAWKTKAIRLRRSVSRSRSVILVTSRPSTRTRPAVGASRPPMMFSSVVLPEPDRPRRATS
jgi:hypothetical protein